MKRISIQLNIRPRKHSFKMVKNDKPLKLYQIQKKKSTMKNDQFVIVRMNELV